MRERFPGPEADHACGRARVPLRPVHRAGLLLHHPEALARHAAIEVVVEGGDVRMAGLGVAQALGLGEAGGGDAVGEAQRIGIPTCEVQRARDLVVIKLQERAHVIVRDEAAGRVLADDVGVDLIVGDDLVGAEPVEVLQVRRVDLGDRHQRHVDLVEGAILHAPEAVAPGTVQRVDGAVARLQPDAERGGGGWRPGLHGLVAAVLVVGLPARETRVIAIAFGEGLDDPAGLFPVGRAREAIVAAGAKAARPAVTIHRQDVRVAVDQPLGRRRRRGAEDNLEAGPGECFKSFIQPSPVKFAGFGLDGAPGEFTNPYEAEPHFRHAAGIIRPHLAGPVFRVIADAEHETSFTVLSRLFHPTAG